MSPAHGSRSDPCRDALRHALASLRPARLLEVGCGGGGFLRSVAGLGIELHGIDPDTEAVDALRTQGFTADAGRAEQLVAETASYDAVVLSFTAHHVEDWSAALHEALRVSRRDVLILDPWFDLSIASQVVAARFDQWCKAIDRATGMIHNDCMDAGALLAPIRARLQEFTIRVEHVLPLCELGVAQLERQAQCTLNQVTDPGPWLQQRDELVALARRDGFSDNGAILLQIAHPSPITGGGPGPVLREGTQWAG